jgi:uncharacterized protein YndB with AHSA1/START domain
MNTGKLEVAVLSDREIKVSRIFDAPPEFVFDAHTKPELIQRWLLGPPGWTMPVCEIDFRVGGKFRYVWRAEDGSGEFAISGGFKEIEAPHRIVHTETFSEDPTGGIAIITSVFAEERGKTAFSMNMLFPSKEACVGAVQSGMTSGMEMSYVRLDEMLGGN